MLRIHSTEKKNRQSKPVDDIVTYEDAFVSELFASVSSEDDPFLLYATLHSGHHCRFVSRDLMRDHKACLPDGAARRLFFKWQRGHQLVVDGYVAAGRRVRFLVRRRRRSRHEEERVLDRRPYITVCGCVFRVSPALTPSSRRQLTRGTSHMMTRMTGAPTKSHNGGFASPESAERSRSFALAVDLKM